MSINNSSASSSLQKSPWVKPWHSSTNPCAKIRLKLSLEVHQWSQDSCFHNNLVSKLSLRVFFLKRGQGCVCMPQNSWLISAVVIGSTICTNCVCVHAFCSCSGKICLYFLAFSQNNWNLGIRNNIKRKAKDDGRGRQRQAKYRNPSCSHSCVLRVWSVTLTSLSSVITGCARLTRPKSHAGLFKPNV